MEARLQISDNNPDPTIHSVSSPSSLEGPHPVTLTPAFFIQKYLLSTYYVLGIILAAGIYNSEQVRQDPLPPGC